MIVFVERKQADIAALASTGYDPAVFRGDLREYKGVSVQKPWGHEEEIHRGGAFSIWRLSVNACSETSMHAHPRKRTMLMVESGYCMVETLSGSHDLGPGDMAHIDAGAFHRTATKVGAVLVEVETPPNKNDLVRLADRYGRQGMGYEVA